MKSQVGSWFQNYYELDPNVMFFTQYPEEDLVTRSNVDLIDY
jgi:hypothetical protein